MWMFIMFCLFSMLPREQGTGVDTSDLRDSDTAAPPAHQRDSGSQTNEAYDAIVHDAGYETPRPINGGVVMHENPRYQPASNF